MPRRSSKRLTGKETKFVKWLSEGLSQAEAARRAGYSEQTARKVAYQVLQRPLVRTAFRDALERAGLTWEEIVKPVEDALQATIHVYDPRRKCMIVTGVPDLKIRQQAHDRAVALYGGVPKLGKRSQPRMDSPCLLPSTRDIKPLSPHVRPPLAHRNVRRLPLLPLPLSLPHPDPSRSGSGFRWRAHSRIAKRRSLTEESRIETLTGTAARGG